MRKKWQEVCGERAACAACGGAELFFFKETTLK